MSISISSSLATPTLATTNASSNAAAARPAQAVSNAPTDTVQLTQAQQVFQLHTQGRSISQIALSLRLTVEAVNQDLGITNSSG